MHELENKPYFKIGEVCEITGTQPYVLRFWESEFPTLAPEKNRSGQRVYRKRDIELIRRIKQLLYEKEYTIAGARKVLESDGEVGDGADAGAWEGPNDAANGGSVPPMQRSTASHTQERRDHAESKKSTVDDAHAAPSLPFKSPAPQSETSLEAEVKNLRAKLSRVEAELKAILDDMDRQDTSMEQASGGGASTSAANS